METIQGWEMNRRELFKRGLMAAVGSAGAFLTKKPAKKVLPTGWTLETGVTEFDGTTHRWVVQMQGGLDDMNYTYNDGEPIAI